MAHDSFKLTTDGLKKERTTHGPWAFYRFSGEAASKKQMCITLTQQIMVMFGIKMDDSTHSLIDVRGFQQKWSIFTGEPCRAESLISNS